MISILDMFKIGIGPSSSHTIGPMAAAKRFVTQLQQDGQLTAVTHIDVHLYGSLALTGKGHQTDNAVILGLAGFSPDNVDIDAIPVFLTQLTKTGKLPLAETAHSISFTAQDNIQFHAEALPLHENGLRLQARQDTRVVAEKTYFSIGGGFVLEESEMRQTQTDAPYVPFPYTSAADLLDICHSHHLTIAEVMMQNELALHHASTMTSHLRNVWSVAQQGIERGLAQDGVLPGRFRVPRRAPALHRLLQGSESQKNDPLLTLDWLNLFALAISEENASGGRVVTAPTNGACGIIPAVLAWYDKFVSPVDDNILSNWYLTASAIGSLYKMNASISGAEVGCQGEVGVACSMAAAALAAVWGGSAQQVCIAAEIAMEHNLGLTCDPLAGQFQVPCIERNAIAAVKAVNAARMALRRSSAPSVSLDKVIAAMYQTGKDMHANYRETSQGGLAVAVEVEDPKMVSLDRWW
ncbi:L-serine dehydratase [Pantoea sp. AS-PWVM4]|uniref:L-serine ammonia-lyase n=1 Tax=Pantoea sp. AS-PWVM4 TaxID=1332069 RepID=UPI0003AC7E1E|nr:L-serine ammonia-lyase [Pantoea sp. AS-PWVM4]ERK09441.1 L-serine dehydratase [Pantoea sp. AS-PWVM4]